MTCIVIEHLCKRASQAGAEAIRSLNRPAFICLYERILPEASEAKHLHSKVKQKLLEICTSAENITAEPARMCLKLKAGQ